MNTKMKIPKTGATQKLKAMYPGDRISIDEVIKEVILEFEEYTGTIFISLWDKTGAYYYRYK